MFDTAPTAILFPGQGSQTTGMRDQLAMLRPDLLDLVLEQVGEDPFPLVGESTRYAQPAICAVSLATWSRIASDLDPVAMAGHSLGELSALAAAGALSEADAIALAAERGRLMARSGEAAGGGTMLALLGATPAQAQRLAAAHRVAIANDNAPGQIVLSGAPDALDAARRRARADGLRAIPLDVAGAFHSPQMAAAGDGLRAALTTIEIAEPRVPVISGVTAAPFTDVREQLAAALTAPVRWRETMTALQALRAHHFIDTGPGRVLAKLVPRNLPGATCAVAEELTGVHV